MKNHSKVSAVIEAAVVFALVFVTSFYDVFYSFDSLLRDKLYQTPRGINNKIKIIAIDDEALREYGAFVTWSRGNGYHGIRRYGQPGRQGSFGSLP